MLAVMTWLICGQNIVEMFIMYKGEAVMVRCCFDVTALFFFPINIISAY